MDLEKYRRPAPTSADSANIAQGHPSHTLTDAPPLGNSADAIRHKTDRYRSYAGTDSSSASMATSNLPELTEDRNANQHQAIETASDTSAKGNRFKSERNATTAQKKPMRPLAPAKRKGPSPQTGVKIVFLDEAMRDEYIQIAGYLMLRFRVKLTMTAYFCFLHDQAVAQQSDDSFMTSLAQFVKPNLDLTNV